MEYGVIIQNIEPDNSKWVMHSGRFGMAELRNGGPPEWRTMGIVYLRNGVGLPITKENTVDSESDMVLLLE